MTRQCTWPSEPMSNRTFIFGSSAMFLIFLILLENTGVGSGADAALRQGKSQGNVGKIRKKDQGSWSSM
jgi:hypothetical protein